MRAARFAAVIGVVVALLIPGAGVAAVEQGPDDIIVTVPRANPGGGTGGGVITNAQLRWGLNIESGAGSFWGGCNFLSAGKSGDAGSSRIWEEPGDLYRASEGQVRIEKPTASGGWKLASFADRCMDALGEPVDAMSELAGTGNQVVIDGGTGRLIEGGGLELEWTGSFTIVFYGGMTYWSVTNPVLRLDAAGNGQLTGTASGFGASMNDTSVWEALEVRTIVLADIFGADIRGQGGFAVVPAYLGVTAASGLGQRPWSSDMASYWGAFPPSFLDYQRLTGQLGYWMTTGGLRDPAKPATTLYVSYDAQAPILAPPPAPPPTDSGTPVNNSVTRPVGAAPVANAPVAAGPNVIPVDPLTFTPERDGLIPQLGAALFSPLLLPLLITVLALLIAVLAVLNMMGKLPWQQVTLSP